VTNAEIISSIFNGLVAAAALAALYLGWRQVGISRELSALEAYENYHLTCLQYPEFSCGGVEFDKFDENHLRKYEVYVLYTLMMGERIFALFPNDVGWRYSICDDIRMHRQFIESEHFSEHLAHQGWKILPLIKSVLAEHSHPRHSR
jgi:hypothetical protein